MGGGWRRSVAARQNLAGPQNDEMGKGGRRELARNINKLGDFGWLGGLVIQCCWRLSLAKDLTKRFWKDVEID